MPNRSKNPAETEKIKKTNYNKIHKTFLKSFMQNQSSRQS